MNARNIAQIENFFLRNKEREPGAINCVTDIVGILIGLKPTALIDFSSEEMKKVSRSEIKAALEKVGLKCIFYSRKTVSANKLFLNEMIFVSKKFDSAVKLYNAFIKMWSSIDEIGQIIDKKTWIKTTRQIGKLLGYPNTAIDSFIKNEIRHKSGNDSLVIISDKYKNFAHSKKYAEKEVKLYNKPLDEAIKKYAPKIYELSNK